MEANVFAEYVTSPPPLSESFRRPEEWRKDSGSGSVGYSSCNSIDSFASSLSNGVLATPRRKVRPSFDKFQVTVKLHPSLTVNTLVSQVRSGPLRAIYELQKTPYTVVMLLFFSERHAQFFRTQVKSLTCVVTGLYPTETNYKLYVTPNSQFIKQTARQLALFARRTLELSRPVPTSVMANGGLIKCAFNPQKLMHIFSAFGDVLQVRPMFRQLYTSFAIDYTAADTAIVVKRIFDSEKAKWERGEKNSSRDCFPNLQEWSLEFTKDNTERDCNY